MWEEKIGNGEPFHNGLAPPKNAQIKNRAKIKEKSNGNGALSQSVLMRWEGAHRRKKGKNYQIMKIGDPVI